MRNISEKFSGNMHKYKTVIWDWNGTLLNDRDLAVGVMNSLLKERELPELNITKYLKLFDFPVKEYYQKLGFDFEKEPFEVVGLEFIKRYDEKANSCKLHKNAIQILNYLRHYKVRQFVLSARNQVQLKEELMHHKIDQYFEKISGLSDDYANGKEKLGEKLMMQNNIERNSSLMIGDTAHDFEVANFLGIDCILLECGHQSLQRLKKCNTKILSGLTELYQEFTLTNISI